MWLEGESFSFSWHSPSMVFFSFSWSCSRIKKEKNYNSKKEDLEEEDQRQDERNVILWEKRRHNYATTKRDYFPFLSRFVQLLFSLGGKIPWKPIIILFFFLEVASMGPMNFHLVSQALMKSNPKLMMSAWMMKILFVISFQLQNLLKEKYVLDHGES